MNQKKYQYKKPYEERRKPLTFGDRCSEEDREIITKCFEAMKCTSLRNFSQKLGISPSSLNNWKHYGFKHDKFRNLFKSTYLKESSN